MQGAYQGAVDDTTRGLHLDPTFYCAYYTRGDAYYHLEQYAAALHDFDTYVTIYLYNPSGYIYRGSTRYALGDYQGAVDDATTALTQPKLRQRLQQSWRGA